MAENSNIEWTDHTFNPWIGCTAVSPACDHCYAEAWDKRFNGKHWGPHATRRRTSAAYWRKVLQWDRAAQAAGIRDKVFCASLADVFDNHRSILSEWRDDLWALIAATPHLDWLLLTKRPQNIKKFAPWRWGEWPENVWIGTTVENQTEADRRIWPLLQNPARVRFLSCEPLLCSVDLTRVQNPHGETFNALSGYIDQTAGYTLALDWIICGGESGPGARPMHPDWVRSLRDQCQAEATAFHFKQWGNWISEIDRDTDDPDWRHNYAKASRPEYQILNLEGGSGFHGDRVHLMRRTQKRTAGRTIDGREWNGFPEVAA